MFLWICIRLYSVIDVSHLIYLIHRISLSSSMHYPPKMYKCEKSNVKESGGKNPGSVAFIRIHIKS